LEEEEANNREHVHQH